VIDPPVWVPTDDAASRPATAVAEPVDEPPGLPPGTLRSVARAGECTIKRLHHSDGERIGRRVLQCERQDTRFEAAAHKGQRLACGWRNHFGHGLSPLRHLRRPIT
jgi:hypothetical protein